MKHKRQKQAKKVLLFYEKHFDLAPPYNILVDATFVKEALVNKVHIWDQLPKYLGAEVHLYTTSCALKELEAFGTLLYGPLKVMREYKVAPCPHVAFGVDPVDCLRKVAKRSHPDYTGQQTEAEREKKETPLRFFVATQHGELADKVHKVPGVPVLYLHGNAVILEKESEASRRSAGIIAKQHLVPQHEEEGLEAALEREGIVLEQDGPVHHKKKLKGPNPLSVLKRRPLSLSRRQRVQERRKWRRLRKRKGGQLSALQELMMREILVEDQLGWQGMVYHRKSLAQLQEELEGAGGSD